MTRWILTAAIIASFARTAAAAPSCADPNPNPGIAPPSSRPLGKSYGEWAARWWKWANPIPAAQNPILDATGEHCGVGQSGPVWFLAGTFGGAAQRECSVPRGKAIFFPILSAYWSQFITDPAISAAEIRALLHEAYIDGAELSATIDGRPVVDPLAYLEESPVITARYPAVDNILGISEEQCAPDHNGMLACKPFLDVGYYLFLEPLPPGDHTIHFSAISGGAFPLELDVSYLLHVE